MWTLALETSEADRSPDFSFECAAIVHLLEEFGGAERRSIEELESHAARRRQAL
jgi:hypothetical protein